IVVFVVMILYESSIVGRTEDIRAEVSEINRQIASYQAERTSALALKQKMDLVTQRLDQHIYWTKFFELLEANTVTDVYYDNAFAGDISGSFNLNATGKDYSSVARQLIAFREATDFVESVSITSATRQAESELSTVSFTIKLIIKPGIFTSSGEPLDIGGDDSGETAI
ncbi:hypothetical protein ACFL04_01460, partial [Patescibacteria group bacterium]